MSDAAQKLLEQIRALPDAEREWLVGELQDEGDGYDPMSDPEFRAELDRTIEAVGDGTATLIPMDEAMALLEDAAGRRRERDPRRGRGQRPPRPG